MNKSNLHIILLMVPVILWASSFAFIRSSVAFYSPGELAFFRFFIASLVLVPVLIIKKSRLPEKQDILSLLLSGFIGISIYHLCLNAGEKTITAGTAGFLAATTPVFMAIGGFFFLAEKSNVKTWIGLLISLAGIAIISFAESGFGKINSGTLLVLLSAAAGAVYVIYQKKLLLKYSPLEVTAYSIMSGTLFLVIYLPSTFSKINHVPVTATLETVYLGVFPAAAAYLIWTYVLPKFSSATHIAAYLYLVPVLSLLIAWLRLNEIPTFLQISGGIITIAGLFLSNFKTEGKKVEKKEI